MIPVLGKLKLFLTDKELIIPQGSLYIINSQEIHGMHHTEDTDIYKGYALQINYDFIKKYYPAIDNYQFIQPNHKIKEKILLDIFKIFLSCKVCKFKFVFLSKVFESNIYKRCKI